MGLIVLRLLSYALLCVASTPGIDVFGPSAEASVVGSEYPLSDEKGTLSARNFRATAKPVAYLAEEDRIQSETRASDRLSELARRGQRTSSQLFSNSFDDGGLQVFEQNLVLPVKKGAFNGVGTEDSCAEQSDRARAGVVAVANTDGSWLAR